MAKISPVSIKYMILASFSADGPLEKPDVIGAIFGQTEGLLGSDLEMRELQKEGKIGRIEVELNTVDGKTVGEIKVPSALDKSETTIIAATLETIDRIGPTEAKIEVLRIEDVRGNKRDYIIERARRLLEGLDSGDELKMSKTLKEESRVARIQEYGAEKLPCGDISGPEVIVVEGRADVVNLLKNRVNNVIGMNGAKLPAEIAELGKEKELTLFIDGDRGGKLIAKNVIGNADISYVAIAPDGKEVEELVGKEILISLRRKMTKDEFLQKNGGLLNGGNNYSNYTKPEEEDEDVEDFAGDLKQELRKRYSEIKDTRRAILFDNGMNELKRVNSAGLPGVLVRTRKRVFAVIVDGQATSPLIKSCDEKGVSYLGATNFAYVPNSKVQLVSI